MKLYEIAKRIDKSYKNEDWMDTEKMGDEFALEIPFVEQERLKCYWIGNWQCTDTDVGYRMYFLDDEAVAYSVQTGRKSDENFYWFGVETAQKVEDYLLSLKKKEVELDINVCDINEDVGDGIRLSYNGEILNSENVTYNGEKVELIERIKNNPYGIDTMQLIKLPNGDTKQVEVSELVFGFHVI